MASIINASTSGVGGVITTADNSGVLNIQTAGTTAISVDTSRNVIVNGTSAINTGSGRGNITLNGTSSGILQFSVSNSDKGWIFHDGTNFTIQNSTTTGSLNFNTNNAERARIDASGNLLVNGTTPVGSPGNSSKINCFGNLSIGLSTTQYRTLYWDTSGNFYFFNGTNQGYLSSAGSWINASDAKLKKDIVDIKYGLNAVLATEPRSYKRTDVEGEYVGFVAQEIQSIIPEVVSGDPEVQLGVDYGSLVAVAFKAIQEQQQIITDLQESLTNLTSRLEALEGVK
jgi:hypothetical protein